MSIISKLKEDNYCIKVMQGESLLEHDLFNKNKLISLNSENLDEIKTYFDLFFIPISINGSQDFFEVEKFEIDKKSKFGVNYSIYKLKLDFLQETKIKLIDFINTKKETISKNVTSLGYKYFDAHSNISGNKEFSTDLPYQDFDYSGDVTILKVFFIIRQFYLDGKKTSIYEEIKKYKNNENYSILIKEIFEDKFFNYDIINLNKKVSSKPRSCIYINTSKNEYKTIQPIITISQLLKFDNIYNKLKKLKYNDNYIKVGGTKPQNLGFLANIMSGKLKYYENKLNFTTQTNTNIYNIKFRLIPKNVFDTFKERRTYKKINHLNQIIANSKTDKKLINELNLILDDLLELIFITIDHIKENEDDIFEIKNCENYNLINNLILNNEISELMEKLKREIFDNLKVSKNVTLYDKRSKFFKNLFDLVEKRILSYV